MTTTGVVFAGGRKEVSDQLGARGERLAEINRAIEQVAEQIKWERAVMMRRSPAPETVSLTPPLSSA